MWFAVHTQPRCEKQAEEHLVRQGFEVFLPQYLKRRSHARRVTKVPAPLFPRYLFIAYDPEQPGLRAVRSTRGVIDLVRNGNDPALVRDDIIAAIRCRQGADGYVVLARHLDLKRGSRVRIDTGVFAGTEAIFEETRSENRVVALLSLLGRKVVANVPIHSIMPG